MKRLAVVALVLSLVAYAAASPPTPQTCDANELKDRGVQFMNLGQYAAALREFESALKCKYDVQYVRLAYLAACNSGTAVKAKLYFSKLPAADRDRILQICLRNGIDPRK
jgi:Tfp pilus assembly protein PilF